jgi:hypothetical protein
MLSDFYFFCIHALIPLHPRVCPVYVLCMSGTHSVLSSSVKSYLRSNLTADSRTSLVPAILHFYFHFYYFHLQMFERFMNCIISFHMVCRLRYTASFTIHCVVYDTLRRLRYTPSCTKSLEHLYYILLFYSLSCIHSCTHPGVCVLFMLCISCVYPVYILSISCVYPLYILCAPGTHSFLSSSVKSYLRSYLTADSRTSLVPAISHFYFHFYYFHLQMFERFMICIVSFHMVCRLRYTTSGVYPVCIPAYILSASW